MTDEELRHKRRSFTPFGGRKAVTISVLASAMLTDSLFSYSQCYDCVDRFGREIHHHQRGSLHVFEANDAMRIACNKCLTYTKPYTDKWARCNQWSDSRCFFDLVSRSL
jgi:hypothetical protein